MACPVNIGPRMMKRNIKPRTLRNLQTQQLAIAAGGVIQEYDVVFDEGYNFMARNNDKLVEMFVKR